MRDLERQRQLKANPGAFANEPKISVVRIFQRDLILTTIQTTAVIGAFMCIYYSVNFWYPTFLRDAGRPALVHVAAPHLDVPVQPVDSLSTWRRVPAGP